MEYRNELKYMVSDYDIMKIRYRLMPLMNQDEHQGEDGYRIRSIYFEDIYDSYMLENEAGTSYRKKYRVRIYNEDAGLIHLEKKMKHGGMVKKVSQEISKDDCDLLLTGKWDSLYQSKSCSTDSLLREVYYEVLRRRLVPKCVVEYERFAFVEYKGNVRITFDRNISGSRQVDKFYDSQMECIPIMPAGYHILEIKYDEILPHYILQSVDTGNLRRQSYSKYYSARKVIG